MPTPLLTTVLADAYGLNSVQLSRLAAGSQTDNYRALLPSGAVLFVKAGRTDPAFRYGPHEAHTAAELSEVARAAGLPVPQLHPNKDGHLITHTPQGVVTVWDFISADTQEQPLTPARADQAGRALGSLHRTFAEVADSDRRRRGDTWISSAPGPMIGRVRELIDTIDSLTCPNALDLDVRRRLQRRQETLEALPVLRRGLPLDLTRGLGHGDYSRVNLLWRGDHLAAVLDFQGHDVPLAWELGRIAFDALTAASCTDWREVALSCAHGYRQANTQLPPDDFRTAPLMMALHALCSLYGVHEHYHNPNPVQEVQQENTQYWINRDTALMRVLDNLDSLQADFCALL